MSNKKKELAEAILSISNKMNELAEVVNYEKEYVRQVSKHLNEKIRQQNSEIAALRTMNENLAALVNQTLKRFALQDMFQAIAEDDQ